MSVPGKPGERIMGRPEFGGPSWSFGPVFVLVRRRGGRLLERPPLVSEPLLERSPDGLVPTGEL